MKPLKAILFAVLLAAPAGHALAQTEPSKDERDAFFAISTGTTKAAMPFQDQLMKTILVRPRDDQKLCDLAKSYTAATWAGADKEQAYLNGLAATGRSIDSLIGSFLGSADLADNAAIHEADYCATATALKLKADETQEAVIDVRLLLARQTAAKTAFDTGTRNHDKLSRLRAIRSQETFLNEIIAQVELIRDYGEKISLEGKAQIAHLPLYKSGLAEVRALDDAEVQRYLDPDPKPSNDTPYVYEPTVLPPVPDDDDAFQKAFNYAMLGSIKPLLHANRAVLDGDTAKACEWARDAQGELERLQVFVQAYIDKRKAANQSTAAGDKAMAQLTETLGNAKTAMAKVCAV